MSLPQILPNELKNHGKDDRPILSGVTALEAEIHNKIEQRRLFYEQADHIVHGQTEANELLKVIGHLI